MSLLNYSDLLDSSLKKSLVESKLKRLSKSSLDTNYDIFLSHSYKDRDVIFKLCELLEKNGFSVYVDWIEDPELDRSEISVRSAIRLRKRMKHCRCLMFVVTGNASESKWMPWELGFMDSLTSKVAIVPVNKSSTEKPIYSGQEYLGLYPYLTESLSSGGTRSLYIETNPWKYVGLDGWLEGKPLQLDKSFKEDCWPSLNRSQQLMANLKELRGL
jgi:hypothetical protein